MKTVRWQDIEAAIPKRLPGYLEAVLELGRRDGNFVHFTARDWRSIRERFTPPLSAELIAHREAVCEACQWNVDWICEHPGCLPCRQRRAGGLCARLRQRDATCPAALW